MMEKLVIKVDRVCNYIQKHIFINYQISEIILPNLMIFAKFFSSMKFKINTKWTEKITPNVIY